MTYQEIQQAEKFIGEIKALSQRVNQGQNLFDEAKTLDGRIRSSYTNYSPDGFSWNTISFQSKESKRYNQSIKNALAIMLSALEAVLQQEPQYGLICQVRDDIERCKEALDYLDTDKRKLVIEMVSKYSDRINFGQTFDYYIQHGASIYEENKTESIFNALIGALTFHLEKISADKSYDEGNGIPTVQVINQQNNTQTVELSLNISIENCFKSLDDCESINDIEINKIKEQLEEIQELLKDKKGKKKPIREKLKAMLQWVADKGTDVMIALLPTLVAILTNLQVG